MILLTSTVTLTDSKIEVLKNAAQISVSVERTGNLTTDASLNVLFTGSNIFYPAANGYDDIKIGLSWNAGEGGVKTAVTPMLPLAEKLAYLDIELVDLLRVSPGEDISGNIAIYQQGIKPSWIPSAPGNYYQQIQVSNSGTRVEVVPVSFGSADEMVGATDTLDGGAGIVPAPVAGDNDKYLKGDGTWATVASVSSSDGIAGINDITSPGGNIDLIGDNGLLIDPDNIAKVVTISLPSGEADNQTLLWNDEIQTYEARDIPVYEGSTLDSVGESGILSAPPAGDPLRYPAADGTWRTAGTIPNQDGGGDGNIVRMTTYANTWQSASNTDTVDELYKAGLCFKQGGQYYKAGATITGLSGLTPGAVYYLGTTPGSITTVVPIPSATTRRVAIGKAIAPDSLIFDPGEVITG